MNALSFEDLVNPGAEPEFTQVPFSHPLWILFSSGTTGRPKGIVHGHGGILLEHLKGLGLCLNLRADDRFFFYSSTSWMAWNFLVGGLLHDATIVLYDGSPTYPGIERLWSLASETRTTVLGLGSAYAAGCAKAGLRLSVSGRLDALRTVIPTGSPLAPIGWRWLHEQLPGDARIDSICGGTDVCTAFFGGNPALPVTQGDISGRWLGVSTEAFDETGDSVINEVGEFVVTRPMPSMPVSFWNDPSCTRCRESYFERYPGVWRQGDFVTITDRGTVIVSGRSDATLNRGGVRLGTGDIYAVVEALPTVRDSLVVGVELPDGDYYMPLFVVPEDCVVVDGDFRRAVANAIRFQLSPRFVPDEIVAVPAIPRTLTGKKLELPVKRILQGTPPEQVAASGAIEPPDAVDWFAEFAERRLAPMRVDTRPQ